MSSRLFPRFPSLSVCRPALCPLGGVCWQYMIFGTGKRAKVACWTAPPPCRESEPEKLYSREEPAYSKRAVNKWFPPQPVPDLPPAEVPSTPVLEASRARIHELVRAATNSSLAATTQRTYNAKLNSNVPRIERALGTTCLPMDTEAKFLAFYAAAAETAVTRGTSEKYKWTHIVQMKAAVQHWHTVRGLRTVADEPWSPQMGAFWTGLKKGAVHTSPEKAVLTVEMVRALLRDAASAYDAVPTVPELFRDWHDANKPAVIAIRTGASAAIAFFGVRRTAEVMSLTVHDLSQPNADGTLPVAVVRQKNDQCGIGQVASLPPMPTWGKACPHAVIQSWLHVRALLSARCDREGRMIPGTKTDPLPHTPRDPLFVCLCKDRWGWGLSADGDRAALTVALNGKLYSARRGGTKYYVDNGAPREAVQAQGGWHSRTVMEEVYNKYSTEETSRAVLRAARRSEETLLVDEFLRELRTVNNDTIKSMPAYTRGTKARMWCAALERIRALLVPERIHDDHPEFIKDVAARAKSLTLSPDQTIAVKEFLLRYRDSARQFLRLRAMNSEPLAPPKASQSTVTPAKRTCPE